MSNGGNDSTIFFQLMPSTEKARLRRRSPSPEPFDKRTSSSRWRSSLAVVGGVLVLFLVEMLFITLTQSLATVPPPKSVRIPMTILLDVSSPPIALNLISICVIALAAALVTNAPDAPTNAKAAATPPPLLSPSSQAAGSSVASRAKVVQISALATMSGMYDLRLIS
jgi:hypothetical protein